MPQTVWQKQVHLVLAAQLELGEMQMFSSHVNWSARSWRESGNKKTTGSCFQSTISTLGKHIQSLLSRWVRFIRDRSQRCAHVGTPQTKQGLCVKRLVVSGQPKYIGIKNIISHLIQHFVSLQFFFLTFHLGVSENSVPLNPMVIMIIIPMKNGYFIGNINPTFSDKPTLGFPWMSPNQPLFFFLRSRRQLQCGHGVQPKVLLLQRLQQVNGLEDFSCEKNGYIWYYRAWYNMYIYILWCIIYGLSS